ncbi:uncharacterized protein LOC118751857 [Rhagoletis pomonella]|uniref:uncharacterized protein LOC118751857 n=1 Tax=Rhagoletis pomonella TaxID=28610 RepID=UPI0017819026|nr:uncharacterized protein LOC118751857 [Rhagoletis pomonella]
MNSDKIAQALEDIRSNHISIRQAANKYGLCRSTLHDRLKGKRLIGENATRMGPAPYLTTEEEQQIAQWCIDLCKCGFPLKNDDLLNTVQKIINDTNRNTPFKNNRPGRTWMQAFIKRNPSLAMREAETISKGRAVVMQETILKWFKELEEYLKTIGQENIMNDASRILNSDETSFCLCPKTGKVIAPKGYKNIYQIAAGNEKETLTVLIVFSADGKLFEPMVVFPYLRPPKEIVDSMPKSWFLGRSESGWMKSETFFEYVANCVHNRLLADGVERPVILFVDGHKSHLTLELSEFCNRNQIILYALPPNTTHIMQPADVSVFKPLKSDWKTTVREWQSTNLGQPLTKKKLLSPFK